ncbi:MAG: ATP-binding cassette domain-containing protein [Peptococcaceae bacterium]|nr:ATP-binding cassette domain-containing protein [Peptococcaceae bacterium]MBO5430043.1 ATP-binding cassette domain-containing protein [Peptococcaceae bacterium]MBQ2776455.1 ATP-binding cassette domain-containing protein [Peptococcaceae bacterium]MBQ2837278.1 ATP-binding cassette domain-containing protein [Peptococcaceae bacterium]MBR2009320.1 ATP-binding cassette domain-containing protein [Peptococcaceae bacterium]
MQTIIKTNELCYKSGRRFLINHINWEVKEGEHWLVFGMNGSGKTTLLSMIAGYKSPTSGTLEVLGKQYDKEHIFALRKEIGWVSSSFFDKYYANETALRIVLSGLFGTFNIDYDVTDADVRRAKALLRELRMEGKMNRPFNSMSKGERQNVLIARALITQPKVLVLDEPGTGLDIRAREHMMNTVRALAESKKVTIIYVTHYPEEVQPFMNKTMLLKNGRAFAKGDTESVLTSENLSILLDETVHVVQNADGSVTMDVDAPSYVADKFYGEQVSL